MRRTASLPIFMEARGESTLQEHIYRCIRQSIVEGLVDRSRRLPSTRMLAATLGVSRTTTLLALEQLRAEGYIVARRGSGTFLAPRLPEGPPASVIALPQPVMRPPFSRRGSQMARVMAPDRRAPATAPRAFRLGTPALDLFPNRVWSRLTRQAMSASKPAQRDYASLAGWRPLREAIAEMLLSRGTRCDASQVQIVAGAQRGLDQIFHLLLDPGDSAWVEEPGYPGARAALIAAGAIAVPVPVDSQGMAVDEARAARLAYVTPSCQFPLGRSMSLERRLKLLQWARRSEAWIVEDDYDCDIRHQSQPLPCLHALDPDGRVIYLGTFSKSVFPALRLGFLVVPRDIEAGFITSRLATDLHPPLLEQKVLAAFIAGGHYQRHVRRMQSAYAERLDALRSAIERSGAPLRLRPVHAGMHAVVEVDGVTAERLHAEAAEQGIECMPLSAYYSCSASTLAGKDENALLLGFGAVTPAAIRAGVGRLARLIERMKR